ncbi:MAG: hypothetical protein IKO41_03125 [Lachnospiraceae bacterium]|nr:hypothetical protein [Lachnospiraceae bacterium]MBR4605202.1 hypothetical protein [Lachnospiraceae bacterium]
MKDIASAKIDEVDMDGVAGGMGLVTEYWQEKYPEYPEENNDDVNVPYVKWAGGDSCNQKMDDDLKNWGITNQK